MEVAPVLLRGCVHVKRAGTGIDDRCRGNANLRKNGAAHIGSWNRRDTSCWVDEADVPERRLGFSVCIKGIDAVVLGHYVNHVVGALTGNVY